MLALQLRESTGQAEFKRQIEPNRHSDTAQIVDRHAALSEVLQESAQTATSELGKLQDTSRRATDRNNCGNKCDELPLVRLVEWHIQKYFSRIGGSRRSSPLGHQPIFLRSRKLAMKLSTSRTTPGLMPRRSTIPDALDFEAIWGRLRPLLPP